MNKQNKQQPRAQPRQAADEGVDLRDNDEELVFDYREPEVVDQFQRQLEELQKQYKWPIDEKEPGFAPDMEDKQNEGVFKEQVFDMIPGLPLFAQRRRQPLLDAEPNPQLVRQVFNKWPQKQQEMYIKQMRETFPEFKTIIFAKEKQMIGKDNDDDDDRGEAERFNPWFAKKEQAQELERLLKEENREYEERLELKRKISKSSRRENQKILSNLLKNAIKYNTEVKELKNLKQLMSDEKTSKTSVDTTPDFKTTELILPSRGTCHLEDLKPEILSQLFSKFNFQGLLVLSKLTLKWNQRFNAVFERQTILWLSFSNPSLGRFHPIEDCCEECHPLLDSEPMCLIQFNKVIDIIEKVLSLTKNLKCLRLYRFSIDRLLMIKKLSENCPQIQHLDLIESKEFTLPVIKELCICYPKLKHLILTATNLTEQMSNYICKNLRRLVTYVVSSTLITGECLQLLPDSLKRLDIRCCPLLNITELMKFLRYSGYIHLQHLRIDAFKNKDIYRLIWTFFKSSLILLEVRETPRDALSGQSYVADIPLLPTLQSLKLGRNVVFEARVFDNFVNSCPNLRSFSMRFEAHDVYRLSEANLIQISHKWPQLERLELICCRFLTEDFVRSLQTLNHLKYLDLTECPQLKDQSMAELLPKLLKVNYLVFDNCLNLGKRTAESAILMAKRISPQVLRLSMLRCYFQSVPALKAKHLPPNIRITYSSLFSRRYISFDGQHIKTGYMDAISLKQ